MILFNVLISSEEWKMKKEKLFNGKAFLWAIIATIMAAIYNSSLTRVRDFVGRTYEVSYLYLFHILFPLIAGIIIALSVYADQQNKNSKVLILIIIINLAIVAYQLIHVMPLASSLTCLLSGFYIVYYICSRKQYEKIKT